MASKYREVLPGLKKLPPESRFLDKGPGFQERVNAVKARVVSSGPADLAARYLQLRDRQDRVAGIVSRVFAELTAVEQMMWDAFEGSGLTGAKLEGGHAVDVYEEPYAQVKDSAAVLEWVKGTPLESRLQLPWQTLNSEVKERLLSGDPIPPGVEVFSRKQTKLRRNRA